MNIQKMKDIKWLISKHGMVVPIKIKTNYIINLVNNSIYNSIDIMFNYNCIIKDIDENDEYKDIMNSSKLLLINTISPTLKKSILKDVNDLTEWDSQSNKKEVLREIYDNKVLTHKEILQIRKEIQNHLKSNILEK